MNPKVDEYLAEAGKWKKGLKTLRMIILECELTEEYKWRHPCYTFNKNNVVLIHEFKDYCAILFYKGALLEDTERILVQQTENVQSARQIRFADISEIENLKSTIKEYIYEAIEVEKAGLKVKKKKTAEFEVPKELMQIFEERPELKMAFENLTAGRQRGYLFHFTKPKQSKTRVSQINKNIERILDGYGLNDCI